MKSNEIKKFAIVGLMTGIVISSGLLAATTAATKNNDIKATKDKDAKAAEETDPNEGNAGYHLMTEDELLLELNGDGATLYHSLDAKGKELARFVASQRCNGTNACAGLNACQTDKNSCAGKGSCEGKGKCALSDKNLAVKLVSDKINMADKRSNITK